ncbi:MAG: hypothetical protein Q9219_001335 [cf. Caloplaca sp. 3 TL-2023]
MTDINSKSSESRSIVEEPVNDPSEPPPPTAQRASSSQPSDVSMEEDLPPQHRYRSSTTLSNHGNNPSQSNELTKWTAPSSICLCQPDPKVPRPRNAFILYRQHHQAHVVAQFPGLANPDISKVIGDHWRQSPPEVKAHWKNLADEEKIRHQRQYPDYRYQPRRNGRNNSLSSGNNPINSPDSENRRCPKCGGRSMTASNGIPSAGFPVSATSGGSATPFSANRPPPTPSAGSSTKRFHQGAGSPPLTSAATNFLHRNRDLSNNIAALGLATPRLKRPESGDFPMSPSAKRQRVAGAQYIAAPPRAMNGPTTPYPFAAARRRESLPRPDFMISPTFAMGPPPRPHPVVSHPPESSLTLPPLQNATSSSGESTTTRAKSVEAMVMSIPLLNKIRILSKISPPLASPSPASPAFATRGFIIAVDGQEATAVQQITAYLATVLETSQHAVKVFQPPPVVDEEPNEEGGGGGGHEIPTAATTNERDTPTTPLLPLVTSISTCHARIAKYHALASELKAYITSPPPPPPPPPPAAIEPTTSPASSSSSSSPAISPKSLPPPPPPPTTRPPTTTTSPPPPNPTNKNTTTPIPIALLPTYQLSQTDAWACRVPIDDSYAPTDHWQWMASMWRGVVGPDVTVAVKGWEEGAADLSLIRNGKRGGGNNSSNNGGGGGEVEVRLEDSRAVVVRAEKGGKGVAEGGLRRVGFEVGEWVRGRGG